VKREKDQDHHLLFAYSVQMFIAMSGAVIEDHQRWASIVQPHSPAEELGYKHGLESVEGNLLIHKEGWVVVDINLVRFTSECNNLVQTSGAT
jgi:hypothetical protein